MKHGPESAFWRKVRQAWKGHAVRIEASDGEVERGTPDTVLSIDHRGGFIELKVWPEDVRPDQIAWHAEALDRGAYAMVLGEMPDGRVWLGSAEDWHRFVATRDPKNQRRRRSDEVRNSSLMNLHAALDVIACALRRTTGG